MKVAHICTSSLSHKILIDKLELLKNKNYSIDIISSKEGYNHSLIKNTNLNFKFVEMEREISPLKDIQSTIKLTKLLMEENYDIVHTHTAKAGLIGRAAAKLARVPLVLHTSHGLPFYEGQSFLKYHLYRNFERIGSRLSDVLLSQNLEDIENLQSISQGRPVLYEGNGINVEKIENEYSKYSYSLSELIKEYGLKEKYIFLVAARFETVKNHDFLIEGIRRLVEKYKPENFIFLLAGEGELESDIREKIVKYNLSKYVEIIGFQKEIYKFIAVSNAVVLTSKKEGLPRILMESMIAQKLIIGTDVLGTRELVIPNETGLLVKPQNIDDLAEKLYSALTEDHSSKCSNGYRYIAENFTENHVVERLHKLYQGTYKVENENK